MCKNFLSIAQYYCDNNVPCAFDAHHFNILNLSNGCFLVQGQCRYDIYKLLYITARLQAPHASLWPSALWHSRLSHPSSKAISFLGSNKLLCQEFKFKQSFCKGCALLTNPHFLPSKIYNEIRDASPFTLVHSNVLN